MSASMFGLIVGLSILVSVLAVLSVGWLILQVRGELQMQRRLDPDATGEERDSTDANMPALMQRFARSGRKFEQMVDKEGESSRLILQAGWRSREARVAWYAFQAALPIILLTAAGLYWAFFSAESANPMLGPLVMIVAAILSFLAPRWILRSAAKSRVQRVTHEVPMFIHLLVLLFESGLTTRQALSSIVREGGGVLPELGREFDLVIRQVEAGAESSEALKTLSDMLGVENLDTVIGVLRQVDRYGGELREPLLETLKVIEERRGFEMRERVNILSGRMTVVMVLFFFPALLIFVAGPAFLGILSAFGSLRGG